MRSTRCWGRTCFRRARTAATRASARPAGRALARVAAVLARRKQGRPQHLVERIDHLGDAQILELADGGGEIAPEVAQQIAPGDLVVGDAVELLFEIGGEAV